MTTHARISLRGDSNGIGQAIAELTSNIQYDRLPVEVLIQRAGDLARESEGFLYAVMIRADRIGPRKPGPYVLATRQTFATATEAKTYADGCAKSRRPIVVEGRWFGLREPK
jgi:hypothetical protein